jgi:photosystem II stability/assembly factor-like uncharacterized protein
VPEANELRKGGLERMDGSAAAHLNRTLGAGAWTALASAVLLIVSVHTVRAGINVWTSLGPDLGTGPIEVVAISTAPPETLYIVGRVYVFVGTEFPGDVSVVLKSTDAGDTWNSVDTGLPDGIDINAITIAPGAPDVVYVAAGMCSCNGTCSRFCQANGVFKSTNGGGSWSAANAGLPGSPVKVLAVDSAVPLTVYAGTDDGLFKSSDGGGTWNGSSTGLPDNPVQALGVDSTTAGRLYAATGGQHTGCDDTGECQVGLSYPDVFKSTDDGDTWHQADQGLPTLGISFSWLLAVAPNGPGTVYVGTGSGVFGSTDAGSTWHAAANVGLPSSYSFRLAVDPHTPGVLYAGATGVFKSTNGGDTWTPLGDELADTHVNELAADPGTPGLLYAGTSLGVYAIQQVVTCAGDCDANTTVTVDEILTLVNIALGNAQPSACPSGIPSATEVDLALILQAVHNALNRCGGT